MEIQKMRLLFVCTGNSFRSAGAEALTRKYKPELEAESAGIRPAKNTATNLENYLRVERAARYLKPKPEELSQRVIQDADKIVCMSEKHKDTLEKNFDTESKEI